MARRSPANPRYRKDAPVGKTRRSASSLKPKRDRGSISAESKPTKRATGFRGGKPIEPTPEMKMWQRVNWLLLGIVIVAATVAFFAMRSGNQLLSSVAVGVEASAFAVSVWVIFGPLRRARAGGGIRPKDKSEDKGGKPSDEPKGKGE